MRFDVKSKIVVLLGHRILSETEYECWSCLRTTRYANPSMKRDWRHPISEDSERVAGISFVNRVRRLAEVLHDCLCVTQRMTGGDSSDLVAHR